MSEYKEEDLKDAFECGYAASTKAATNFFLGMLKTHADTEFDENAIKEIVYPVQERLDDFGKANLDVFFNTFLEEFYGKKPKSTKLNNQV